MILNSEPIRRFDLPNDTDGDFLETKAYEITPKVKTNTLMDSEFRNEQVDITVDCEELEYGTMFLSEEKSQTLSITGKNLTDLVLCSSLDGIVYFKDGL